jgi:hypothetical protein
MNVKIMTTAPDQLEQLKRLKCYAAQLKARADQAHRLTLASILSLIEVEAQSAIDNEEKYRATAAAAGLDHKNPYRNN